MALVELVRNFQSPNSLATTRIVQQVTKRPAQRARQRWGAVGTLPTPSTGGFNTVKSDKYKEKTRNASLVKVVFDETDPNNNYLVFESVASSFFEHQDPDTITVSFQKTYTMYGPPQLTGVLAPQIVNVATDQNAPQSEFDFLPENSAGLRFTG